MSDKELIEEARRQVGHIENKSMRERLISDLAAVERVRALHPVIDEDALAEVIEAEIDKLRHETRLYPDIYKAEVARAVAEWLKEQGVGKY